MADFLDPYGYLAGMSEIERGLNRQRGTQFANLALAQLPNEILTGPQIPDVDPQEEEEIRGAWFKKWLEENIPSKKEKELYEKYWKKKGTLGKIGTGFLEGLRGFSAAVNRQPYFTPRERFREQALEEFKTVAPQIVGAQRLEDQMFKTLMTEQRLGKSLESLDQYRKQSIQQKEKATKMRGMLGKMTDVREREKMAQRGLERDRKFITDMMRLEIQGQPRNIEHAILQKYPDDLEKQTETLLAYQKELESYKARSRSTGQTRLQFKTRTNPTFDPKSGKFAEKTPFNYNPRTGTIAPVEQGKSYLLDMPQATADTRTQYDKFGDTVVQVNNALSAVATAAATGQKVFGIYDNSFTNTLRNMGIFDDGVRPELALFGVQAFNAEVMHAAGMQRYRPALQMIEKLHNKVTRKYGNESARMYGLIALKVATQLAQYHIAYGEYPEAKTFESPVFHAKLQYAMTRYVDNIMKLQPALRRAHDPKQKAALISSANIRFPDIWEIAGVHGLKMSNEEFNKWRQGQLNPLDALQQGVIQDSALEKLRKMRGQ